ncbi:bacteriocin%2C lactococcin 972 family [Chlamydia trachomatis]|nr:bacteriocin%2C lactococcin 972 family [Chlamydia trachomatis]
MFVRKKAAAGLGASLIALSAVTAMPADAKVEYVDGGVWDHGVSRTKVWANYKHNKKRYGVAVQGVYYADSGCVGPRKWARASAPRAWWGGNRAWYYIC